jgi:hypothetical protein
MSMSKPELTDREKFDAVTYQQFKPDPPKKSKGIWRVVSFLFAVLFFALIALLLFGH